MFLSLVILSFLLGACAQQATPANFIGFTKSGNSYVSFTCPDSLQTFTSSSSWWGCASSGPDTTSGIATACVTSNLIIPGGTTFTCNVGFICATGYLYSDPTDQSPLSEYGCLNGGGTILYYRSVPTTSSEPSAAQTNTNTGFIGYRKTGNSYVAATCPDTVATFATSGSYWGCSPYPAVGLGLVTGCTSGTLLVGGTDDYTCNAGYECNTGYWFSDLNDQSPLSEYACYDGGTTSYYGSLPASVLATITGAAATSSASSTGITFTQAPATNTKKSSSKAWIAGAVIGPVFGIAVMVGLGVWIWTRRKRTKQGQLAQDQQQPIPVPKEQGDGTWVFVPASSAVQTPKTESPAPAWSPPESELPAEPYVPELHNQRAPAELDSGARNN